MGVVTTSVLRRIRELHEKGLSYRRISELVGFSELTCWRHAKDENHEKLTNYKRDYLARKRNPLLYVRTIPLGPGGWPKKAEIYSRRDDSAPVFTFTRVAPRKLWIGPNGVRFSKLGAVKAWALEQPAFKEPAE